MGALEFSLIASGQIKLRKLDGFEEIAKVLSEGRNLDVEPKTEKTIENEAA